MMGAAGEDARTAAGTAALLGIVSAYGGEIRRTATGDAPLPMIGVWVGLRVPASVPQPTMFITSVRM